MTNSIAVLNQPSWRAKDGLKTSKKRHNLHNFKLVGKSASADHEAAKKFPEEFKIIIEKGGYQPPAGVQCRRDRIILEKNAKQDFSL